MTTHNKDRYVGLDLIRITSMLPIIGFHLHDMIYDTKSLDLSLQGSFFEFYYHWIMKPLTFSGFTIVFLSFFLYGKKGIALSSLLKLILLIFIGTIVLVVSWGEDLFIINLEWDIYLFLFVAFISTYYLQGSRTRLIIASIISIVLLSSKVWELPIFSGLPQEWQKIFIGSCSKDGQGLWPLLPWLGLPWLAFSLGQLHKEKRELAANISFPESFHSFEIFLWPILLIFTVPQLWPYTQLEMGSAFPCFIQRQSPFSFWSYLLSLIFLVRLSLVTKINNYLTSKKSVVFISQLCWSKKFGLCYFLHIFNIALTLFIETWIESSPTYFTIILITIPLLTEVQARFLISVKLERLIQYAKINK